MFAILMATPMFVTVCYPLIDYKMNELLLMVNPCRMVSDGLLDLCLVVRPPHTGSRYPPGILISFCVCDIENCIGWPS